MSRKIKLILQGLILVLPLLFTTNSQADIVPGVRTGAYFDADSAFIGGELLARVAHSWYFNPNVEFIFQSHVTFVTFNFDIHYDIPTREPVYFWVGGGPAILYRNPDRPFAESKTDPGFNLFFGVGFNKGGAIIPYVQAKGIISDTSDFSLAFGVRF